MRVLRQGLYGDDVRAWETFLVGQGYYAVDVDGKFDEHTQEATESFQNSVGLKEDGVVGMQTYGAAARFGFDLLEDDDESRQGPNWPPVPDFLRPLRNDAERAAVFGRFSFRPSPVPGNREAITITDGWAQKNIVMVEIPQLAGVKGAGTKVPFHRDVADHVRELFATWEKEGLLHLVMTWGGSWAPRFIRGSSSILSNHAYGSAFDVNVPWNGLGVRPALVGQTGTVRPLVPVANDLGWYWGGHFSTRADGMHLERAVRIR